MIRTRFVFLSLGLTISLVHARAGDQPKVPLFNLPSAAPLAGEGPARSPVAVALAWLGEKAPECPTDIAPEIAAKFVAELGRLRPGDIERLGTAALTIEEYDSLLWQVAAARLSGPAYATQRETFAQRRVAGLLARARPGSTMANDLAEAQALVKTLSAASARRLLEGKMDDDDLQRLVTSDHDREARRKDAAATAARPKVLSAQDIVGEFARRNQVGAAAAKLRAYQVEARLRNPDHSEMEVRLFKLRPDLFRVHLRPQDGTAQVITYDGTQYWRQAEGRVGQVSPESLGSFRYLGEFLDPLFETAAHHFERLEDAMVDGRKCYRVAVKRSDGSGYVAVLDQENIRQIGRENSDGSRVRYTDFRDFSGLTVAFREEVTFVGGTTAVLVIRRITANPGLVAVFFQQPTPEQLDLGSLEQVLARNVSP